MTGGRGGGGRNIGFTPQDSMLVDYSGGAGYMYSPAGGGVTQQQVSAATAAATANFMRSGALQQVSNQPSELYLSPACYFHSFLNMQTSLLAHHITVINSKH